MIAKIDIDEYAEKVTEPPENLFPDLIGTQFFKGPLTKEEATIEVDTYFKNTHPALLFRIGDNYFCVYP